MIWLTADLVENIHSALSARRPVSTVIAGLRGATLPGLLGYLCLRWSPRDYDLPDLPPAILHSPFGRSVQPVCKIVDRGLGREHQVAPCSIEVRSIEFIALFDEDHRLSQDWELYLARFSRSARHAGFSTKIADSLAGAVGEMADNALLHASSPKPVIVGYHASSGVAQFCVVDLGIGVLASLTSCPAYAHLKRHNDAIRAALHDGVTRYATGGGFGFREVFKALTAQYGHLRFRSGEGCISMDGLGLDADHGQQHFLFPLPGFQVSVTCRVKPGHSAHPVV